jgi:hypothetical protein
MKKSLFWIAIIAILGLIVSGCIAPLESVVPTSEKGNSKPEFGTPTIEKITFIHYAKSSGRSKPVWDDTQDDFKKIAGGVKWSSAVSYEVNPTGSDLDNAIVLNTLNASLESWDSKTSFELFASLTQTTETSIGYDDTNRVIWEALSPGVIAVNYLWYNPATKQIVESDIIFNTGYTWKTTGASDAMDLQNIATHEFGHNGLNDLRPPKDWALTMYAYSSLGETYKQTLGNGDILGIQELYGSP